MPKSKATDLLRQDHERLLGLFGAIERAAAGERLARLGRLAVELARHAAIEEELSYAAVRDATEGRGTASEADRAARQAEAGDPLAGRMADPDAVRSGQPAAYTPPETTGTDHRVRQAIEDHDGIRIALEGLQAMPPASDEFDARLGELRDALADHVRVAPSP